MTKKRRLGLAAVLAIVLCGGLVVWLWQTEEPVYKRKPLHYWLQGYDNALRHPSSAAANSIPRPTRFDADKAVLALGTNAIPELLRMIVYQPPPLRARLLAIGQKLQIVKGQPDNPYAPNLEAQKAFGKLADRAAAAVPELIRLYDTHPDPPSRTAILFVLQQIGPKAQQVVPVLLRAITNANEIFRSNAASALSNMDADDTRVVPALSGCLKDPSTIVRINAILALNHLGKKAKPAVPALLQFLHDEKYDPASAPDPWEISNGPITTFGDSTNTYFPPGATPFLFEYTGNPADFAASALWEIDPDAAAKAHLKRPE